MSIEDNPNAINIQVAAVCFRNMVANSIHKLSRAQEKPYYYLDVHGLKVGDLAFVHNGEHFGLVEVMRLIPPRDATALARVNKPILAKVEWNAGLLEEAAERLKNFRDHTADQRVALQIDRDLGLVSAEEANKKLADYEKIIRDLSKKGITARGRRNVDIGNDFTDEARVSGYDDVE